MSALLERDQPTAAIEVPASTTPAAPAPADPPATPQAAPETEAPQDTGTDQARDQKGRFTASKERIERQISELTAKKHAERRELETLQRQVAALRNQYQEASRVDPNDLEARETARTQQAVIGVQHGLAQQQVAETASRLAETRQATFMAKVDAARERIPDIDQALASFARLPVSDIAADLIAESDRSVEIANFLARNPNEAYRISALHPAYQGAEIARIEARVAAQPVKRISQAPAPVQTVSGGAGNPGVDLGSLSMADYIKAREAGAR